MLDASELEGFASYHDAHVFAEPTAGTDPEVIYVLLGARGPSDEGRSCEYQPYQVE